MTHGSRFVDGTNIKTGKLVGFFASSFIFAWFSGLVNIVLTWMLTPAVAVQRFLEWTRRMFSKLFSEPAFVLTAAWTEASAFVADLGPFAFIAGVVTVAAFFPFASWLFEKWGTLLFDL